ncbi:MULTISPECIES: fatty acid cis/trans isomerase [unclassified Pseudoalteromonas]|uniref:fatty acid cis/trans isomerase n=1 Tax=unclassified Pseudoalteromonas TaxID=194690 RepID=UPI0025B5F48B|nr:MULTISPECIES: fatty acid cis/trans isomerase [unclassified Pseudoalteromonas]MDN3379373.1 fatty acid cis/trans isomerase [Pseudoalteromonas sp. APC 3893]MDN3386547.1 fatty acid cis/trans isomerase [Pseudoalteromonas sp. APC 4017]
MKKSLILSIIIILSGCAYLGAAHYDELFGPEQIQQRIVEHDTGAGAEFLQHVQPVLDTRCVVCHGCYDAPCQLKLSSPEGIDRGLSKELVYDGTRLLASNPSRLLYDAADTAGWREKNFSPVLNERAQSEEANLAGSVLYNSLVLKMSSPLPEDEVLGDEFDFALDRSQTCASMGEFDRLADSQPHAGMPYGLPGISRSEFKHLEKWLKNGGKMAHIEAPSKNVIAQAQRWESFLNQDSLKHQLTARYVYEHWYLAHIYFVQDGEKSFFKLVRSSTPPGEDIKLINTRRPYDDPKVERVYYRLMHERSTILAKTHLPLALNDTKLARLYTQFIQPEYQVSKMPSYKPEVASNPFKVFAAMPVKSKYQFMLDEAELIIMGFIKGPVCRGQIALNVINDHFWVAFADPDKAATPQVEQMLLQHEDALALPAAEESNALPISSWVKYSKRQSTYLEAKVKLANEMFENGEHLTTDALWRGEDVNDNAALTIFRHFDSATVVKGLIGQEPKTMWILDYALFERIHYLLVAGFDVYGNIGHQLVTRLYMDFLRLEGEQNFLALLPKLQRQELKANWYRKSPTSLTNFFKSGESFGQTTGIEYQTQDQQHELYGLIKQTLKPVLSPRYDYTKVPEPLHKFNNMPAKAINLLPQISYVLVKDGDSEHEAYTLIHHNAHYNISSLLNEEGQRAYDEDTLTIVPGFIGDYPEAIWYLNNQQQVEAFAEQLPLMQVEADYRALKSKFAIRRTHPQFWQYSDILHNVAKQYRGIEYGLFDYNRLENR